MRTSSGFRTNPLMQFRIIAVVCLLQACGGGGSSTTSSTTATTTTGSTTIAYNCTSESTKTAVLSASTSGTMTSTSGVFCSASGTGTTITSTTTSPNKCIDYTYTWSCGGRRTLSGNGIPNHSINNIPNSNNNNLSISSQTVSVSIPLATASATDANNTGTSTNIIGYGINSVKFEPNTAGGCSDSATTTSQCNPASGTFNWNLEALWDTTYGSDPRTYDFFGADSNNAHVQPSGAYHYHGAPTNLYSKLGGTVTSGIGNKMIVVGWAMDGYPIYYKYGYTSDSNTTLIALKGSYTNDASTGIGTRPSTTTFPYGVFREDWQYTAGSGDLDKCNGRTGKTPEFPNGTYYYVVTDTYPFAPRCLKGST